jgi:hypothetical protein
MENAVKDLYFNGRRRTLARDKQDLRRFGLLRTTDDAYVPLETVALQSYQNDRLAQMIYGSKEAPELSAISGMKDRMLKNSAGRMLVDLYYSEAHRVADLMEQMPLAQPYVRKGLDWFVRRYS